MQNLLSQMEVLRKSILNLKDLVVYTQQKVDISDKEIEPLINSCTTYMEAILKCMDNKNIVISETDKLIQSSQHLIFKQKELMLKYGSKHELYLDKEAIESIESLCIMVHRNFLRVINSHHMKDPCESAITLEDEKLQDVFEEIKDTNEIESHLNENVESVNKTV